MVEEAPGCRAKSADDVAIDPVEGKSVRAAGMALVAIGIGGQRNIGRPRLGTESFDVRPGLAIGGVVGNQKGRILEISGDEAQLPADGPGRVERDRRDEIAPGKLLQQWLQVQGTLMLLQILCSRARNSRRSIHNTGLLI